jgi:integrase
MSELELAKYPGLYQRDGVWYVRKRVPKDLIHAEKRSQIRLSLGTSSRKDAVDLYPVKMAEITLGFKKLREQVAAQGVLSEALTTARIELLGRAEVEKLVADWWSKREGLRKPVVDQTSDPDEMLEAVLDDADRVAHPGPEDGDVAGRLADRLLVDAGMAAYPRKVGAMRTASLEPAVDRTAEQYHYLCKLISRAMRLEGALAKDHLLGREDAPYDRLFNPTGLWGEVDEAHTVRDLVRQYRAEREAEFGKESTDRKYGLLFRILEEVLGPDTPVRSIGRAQCVEVMSFLKRMPPNATKRFPKLTLAQAVAKADAEGLDGLAPNTVASYMQNFSAMLRWAEDWGAKVATRGLVRTRKAKVKRRRFYPEELRKLFAALEPFRSSDPTKYWVPALALFTGARAGEICQLRVEDIEDVDGIRCLNLSEFDSDGRRVEDKHLKTSASERYVPLHSALIQAGFLDFVEARHGEERLFPDLKPGPKNSYSHNFSKWFGAFKKRVGFDQPSLVFHSFRHGFRDACRTADIPEETSLALGGWAGINQATRYGDRAMVPVLDRAMQKIAFDDFTLPRARRLPPARRRSRGSRG